MKIPPTIKRHRRAFIVVLTGLLVLALVLFWPSANKATAPGSQASKRTSPSSSKSAFDKSLYPSNRASSLWAVVNKGRVLPSNYVPAKLVVPDVPLRYSAVAENMHLRSDAAQALETLVNHAGLDGMKLMLTSGYRSYSYQQQVYKSIVASDGQAHADVASARPGHSEHQTGLAADLEPASGKCELNPCFGATPEGRWLAANSYKYGFIIRYQKSQQNLTGYEYEPWHIRYVGVALAAQIHKSGRTLEQFFGLPSFTSYPPTSMTLKR